ncbi:hypothetical protein A2U01_0068277 [Trifolium medium]|uniref:Uncharacterized protein n=1 Tax=Trifolium medium TaxID=97028 RepID=A0A392SGP8_9FABA|nr:hypothetical protein [Trifolium medium]
MKKKQEVSCGTSTVQTMEGITVVIELHIKYYNVVSGGQHSSKIVINMYATVINASE